MDWYERQGLIYYDRKNQTFKNYRHQVNNPNSISNDIVVSLFIDDEKKLWIGTYFGGLDCFDGQRFKNYRHKPDDSNSIGDDRIWDIIEGNDRKLWIGTLGGGVDLLDRSTVFSRITRPIPLPIVWVLTSLRHY